MSAFPFENKQVIEAISDLNVARKSVAIYPAEHVQVKTSIARALKSLNLVLQKTQELTITVAKATLLIGEQNLDKRNVGWQELAYSLSQHEIAAICFYPGIEMEELLSFLTRIARPTESKNRDLSSSCWPNIQVQLIDYSQLYITDEAEIWRSKGITRTEDNSIWKDFVTHLVTGNLSKSEDGASLSDFTGINPIELTDLLNQKKIDINSALNIYQQMLSNQPYGQARSDENRSITTGLPSLNMLLQNLNPELRSQFLSVTFKYLSEQTESIQTAIFLSGISRNLLVEMLQQANRSGKEISPSLIRLLRKLADIQGQNFDQSSLVVDNSETAAADLESLFKREDYEEFVTSQYDAILKQIETAAKLEGAEEGNTFPINEYLPTLEEQYLTKQIASMLIAFINENIQADEYQVYADKLMVCCRELLDGGDFMLVIQIYNLLNQHATYRQDLKVRSIAEKTIQLFKEPLFTSKAVKAFHVHYKQTDKAVFEFLISLGPQIIPDVLNLYTGLADFDLNQHLFDLLVHFPEHTLAEAQKRLRDTRHDYVKNLIILVREVGGRGAADILRPLWEHTDQRIQMEVLGALLKFQDKWGLLFLRRALKSSDSKIVYQSVQLAEFYKVFEVAQDLALMLKRRPFLKAGFDHNQILIKALGNIGNPVVIPLLKKIAGLSWSLYPQALTDMQRTLFKSLNGYPFISVRDLLYVGLSARDEVIRKICQELLLQDTQRNHDRILGGGSS